MNFESVWTFITDFMTSIPPVVWGGVVASCITFTGVVLSNRHTLKRLRIQLDADAKQKKEERTSSLRKDVLLSLTEELMGFGQFLTSLLTTDPEKFHEDVTIKKLSSVRAKAHVVADPSTVIMISKIGHLYITLHSAVMSKIG